MSVWLLLQCRDPQFIFSVRQRKMLAAVLFSLLSSSSFANETEVEDRLQSLVTRIKSNPEQFVKELQSSEFAAMAPVLNTTKNKVSPTAGEGLPLVFLHGMGDSCFNNGMASLTEDAGNYKGVYSVCIPTGDTRLEDTINGKLSLSLSLPHEW
jgi:hypothetical protein